MAIRHSIEAQLGLHEGTRSKLYRDSLGIYSIGTGRNLRDVGLRPDEIALMLRNDIAAAKAALDQVAPWWRDLDEVRQKVLIDMAFNLGPKGLAGFRNTLRDIQARKYAAAAKRMLASRWATQVGARARRLSEMMRTGEDYR